MTIQLRPYQQQLVDNVRAEWADGATNVLLRADTGAGKTAMLGWLIQNHQGASCVIAHRSELVSQLSLTLARYGVRHDLQAAANTRKAIARAHVEELGACFYQPGARCVVASVDTLIRAENLETWAQQVTLWICDEGHHLVRDNKWCKAVSLFTHPQCHGLLPTATPKRADGKGLGSHADGYADVMIEGPPMRWLIEQGWLTDYRIVCPPSDLKVLSEPGASGDWSTQQLRDAAKASHIVGDVVEQYVKRAMGRLGITFCTDVETAVETTQRFRESGVPAETLTGNTADHVRRDILRRYRARQILQLVTVDIVSEGFDLPAIEVASMARPTQSLALYMQQFGRALRPMDGKQSALIIDHVSNVIRHQGPPDKPRVWSLDRRDKRAAKVSDAVPYRVCVECTQPYERFHRACPHCGFYPEPAGRSAPEQVDGDLAELDAATLARLRGAVVDLEQSLEDYAAGQSAKHARPEWIGRHVKAQDGQRAAQMMLREAMGRWGGARRSEGLATAQIQRLWYLTYGVDVLSAQALGTAETWALLERVKI